MQDFTLIQTFLAAMVTAALATGILMTVADQSRKVKKAIAYSSRENGPDLSKSTEGGIANPVKLNKNAALTSRAGLELPDRKAPQKKRQPSGRQNRVSMIDDSRMDPKKQSLEDLNRLVHTRPAFVLSQLNTFYGSDIQDTHADTLTMCIESLINAQDSMDSLESKAVLDSRTRNAQAFSSILDLSKELTNQFDTLTKQKDNQSSSYSDPVNQVSMLTGTDINEQDDGTGFYPFERISYILDRTYGDRRFGDAPVYKIVDPTLAYSRVENQSSIDSQSAQNHLLSESDHGVDVLLKSLSDHEHASFCLMKGESHFVSGALVKHNDNVHLIMLDSIDHQPQGDDCATAVVRGLLKNKHCHIDDKDIHDQYRCLKENDVSVDLQRDRHNCGPWSIEVLSRLTKDRCLLIAAEPQALDGLVMEVANTRNPNHWTVENSRLAGEDYRHKQYQFISTEIKQLQNDIGQCKMISAKRFKI